VDDEGHALTRLVFDCHPPAVFFNDAEIAHGQKQERSTPMWLPERKVSCSESWGII